jgi:hypothetical protein
MPDVGLADDLAQDALVHHLHPLAVRMFAGVAQEPKHPEQTPFRV